MAKTTVRIDSDLLNGCQRLTVNGVRKDVPHNCDVELDDDELHALENSTTAFRVVGGASVAAKQDVGGARPRGGNAPPKPRRRDPLDHDGNGKKGGSLKGIKSTVRRGIAKLRGRKKA